MTPIGTIEDDPTAPVGDVEDLDLEGFVEEVPEPVGEVLDDGS